MTEESKDKNQIKTEYFDKMAPEWDTIIGNDEKRKAIIKNIINTMGLTSGMNVLDVGCGTGITVSVIHDQISPKGKITAIDPSAEMIKEAQKNFNNLTNVTWKVGLLEETKFKKNEFDVIIAFAVFPHIDDKPAALKVMRHCLKKDGKLFIFHLSDTKSLNNFHRTLDAPVKDDVLPSKNEFTSLFKDNDFRLINYVDEENLNLVEARPCL